MTQRILTPPAGPARRAAAADTERLRWRVAELEEQVRRLERERREFALLAEQRALDGDTAWRDEIAAYLRERAERLTILRDGRPVPRRAVPPEAVLDLLELTRWRQTLGEALELATLVFLRDETGFREANNSPLQVAALIRCPAACRQALADAAHGWDHRVGARPVPTRCPACGRSLAAAPLALGEGEEQAVLGWLVAHDLPAPAAPHRRLLALAARWFSRRAEDEYLLQLHMVRQMSLVAMADAHSRRSREEARRLREEVADLSRRGEQRARALQDLEAAYRQARETLQQAEKENLAKDLFLAAMSHEIRTPLTCVIGFADLLTLPGVGEAEAAEFARSIRQSGQLLLSLINNILDLSKLEAGRLELDPLPFSPAELLRRVVEILEPSARGKGLTVTVELDPSLAAEDPVGDAARLEQVLVNLVGNAVKFTREGGVTVRARRVREDGDWLELAVADTGPGIPPARREEIFEPFTQLAAGRGQPMGSGLGLAIARRLARAMGGDLTVADAPGGGSLFVCRVPWRLAPATEPVAGDG